jgi:coenzyme F420-0:L-glutamate ligase
MDSRFVQTILDEADVVVGGVPGALLTIVERDATANAGVDQKNSPHGTVVLWPKNPDMTALEIGLALYRKYRKKLGIVIVDSRVTPLRLGTIGLAIGCYGFSPVKDFRDKLDIYGRKVQITRQAIADGIAAAAQLVMGEIGEKIPFVLVRNAPITLETNSAMKYTKLEPQRCLYMSQILGLS